MPVYNWDDLPEQQLNALVSGKIIKVPNAMVARIKCPAGNPLKMHVHDFDQVTHMIAGKIRWYIEGEPTKVVGPGDVMIMKAGVSHGGEVLEDAEYIDVFAPDRQDFGWNK